MGKKFEITEEFIINNSGKILDNAMSYFLSFEGRSYEKQQFIF